MRELAILTFVTLDGVMQAVRSQEEDTSDGFVHGGWASDYWEEVMEQVREEAMAVPYDLLIGRTTYEMFAASPNADSMRDATKYVVTSNLANLSWDNSVHVHGDIVTEISKLKAQEGPLLQVHGSWQLIQTLIAHDLVDEFRLWIFPVVVGSGKRLFDQVDIKKSFELIKTRATSNGVVMCIYRHVESI